MGCDICCEDAETIACKNEQCDWNMCNVCTNTYNSTRCPACRTDGWNTIPVENDGIEGDVTIQDITIQDITIQDVTIQNITIDVGVDSNDGGQNQDNQCTVYKVSNYMGVVVLCSLFIAVYAFIGYMFACLIFHFCATTFVHLIWYSLFGMVMLAVLVCCCITGAAVLDSL